MKWNLFKRRDMRNVDPKIKKFFPWGLFFVVALIFFSLAFATRARSEADVWACYNSQRYQAMSSGWTPCNELSTICSRVQQYLLSHTVEEGRAEAAKQNVPSWLVRRAERCIPHAK